MAVGGGPIMGTGQEWRYEQNGDNFVTVMQCNLIMGTVIRKVGGGPVGGSSQYHRHRIRTQGRYQW